MQWQWKSYMFTIGNFPRWCLLWISIVPPVSITSIRNWRMQTLFFLIAPDPVTARNITENLWFLFQTNQAPLTLFWSFSWFSGVLFDSVLSRAIVTHLQNAISTPLHFKSLIRLSISNSWIQSAKSQRGREWKYYQIISIYIYFFQSHPLACEWI